MKKKKKITMNVIKMKTPKNGEKLWKTRKN